MAISDHKTLRRIIQWGFPGELVSLDAAWNGSDDIDEYLTAHATWAGDPVSASAILAKEADYTAAALAKAKAEKLSALAEKRWQVEVGGLTVGNVEVDTDDRAKLLLFGAEYAANTDPNYTVSWKVSPGGYATLDASTILTIAAAVKAHITACFANEESHADSIAALTTIQAVEEYDISGGW